MCVCVWGCNTTRDHCSVCIVSECIFASLFIQYLSYYIRLECVSGACVHGRNPSIKGSVKIFLGVDYLINKSAKL